MYLNRPDYARHLPSFDFNKRFATSMLQVSTALVREVRVKAAKSEVEAFQIMFVVWFNPLIGIFPASARSAWFDPHAQNAILKHETNSSTKEYCPVPFNSI